MKLEFKGKAEMQRKLDALAKKFPHEVGQALYEESKIEMAESQRRVPFKTGALHDSAQVHPPETQGTHTVVRMSYGDSEVNYAVYVHENLEAFHPHGQAKFLESVLMESAPHMANRVAMRLALQQMV